MANQMTIPDRLTAKEALIRAKAADHIARGKGWGSMATERQKLRARELAGVYRFAAELLTEVDSDSDSD